MQQVRQQLEIARALLDADKPVDLAHHAVEQGGRAIGPGHDIVDHHRLGRLLGQGGEVGEHHFVTGAEEIMHRRHLQSGDIEVGQRMRFFDCLARAVDDDAGDDRRAPGGNFAGNADDLAQFVRRQRVTFARAAANGDAMCAGG